MTEFAVYKNADYKYFLNMEGDTIAYFLKKIKNINFDCSYIIVDQLFYTGMAINRILKFRVINGYADMKTVEYFNDMNVIKLFNVSIMNSFKKLCEFYLSDVDFENLIETCDFNNKKPIIFTFEDI